MTTLVTISGTDSGSIIDPMKRLFQSVLISVVVVALLCTAAILIGRGQPPLTFIPELQPCGNSFCYLGIKPGITSWNAGLAILWSNPKLRFNSENYVYEHSAEPAYSVYLEQMGGVGGVDIYPTEATLSAGKIISIIGSPCYIGFFSDNADMIFSHVALEIDPNNFSITPNTPLLALDVEDSQTDMCTESPSNLQSGLVRWHGFGDYAK